MCDFPGEKVKLTVTQTPQDLITNNGDSMEIECSHNIPNYDRLLWYKQSKTKELIFMGYLLGENGYPEEAFQKKIKIHGNANKYKGFLTVDNLTLEHRAIYYCAAYYTVTPIFFLPYKNMPPILVGYTCDKPLPDIFLVSLQLPVLNTILYCM